MIDIEWTLASQAYFDQLSLPERSKIELGIERLREQWPELIGDRLVLLKTSRAAEPPLYSFRVGGDLRMLVSRRGDAITIVDIVRRSQIEGLRGIGRLRRAGAG